MELSKHHIKTILYKLQEVYPFMLNEEGYKQLAKELGGETVLDAHLLYLWEKGLINTEMSFDVFVSEWQVNAQLTRINSAGIDVIENSKDR
ncbi:hypothetical protein [Pantoea sp. R13S299]|uniref:hypothetical protein n=1 Tax=Pantoea TaxID=53335 RepID=UPI003AE86B5D